MIERLIEWLLAAALGAGIGLQLAGIWVVQDGKARVQAAATANDFETAIATDSALQQLSGSAFALAKQTGIPSQQDVQALYVRWANSLAQQGNFSDALGVAAFAPIASQQPLQQQQLLLTAVQSSLSKQPDLAWKWMQVLIATNPSGTVASQLKDVRVQVDLAAAPKLSSAQLAPDAVSALDDAVKNGTSAQIASANQLLPPSLLSAGQQLVGNLDFSDASTALQRLVNDFGGSAPSSTAQSLLSGEQSVAGTLLDGSGNPMLTQLRLDANFSIVSSGLISNGPYYSGSSDSHGDFRIDSVPVGGPYAIELFRNGSWAILLRVGGQAQTVTVQGLNPQDLTYLIVS